MECTEVIGISGNVLQIPDYIDLNSEIVRCRDCKYGIDGGEYCAEDCADSWDWRCVEPDGFCAWGERRERESAEVWNQWSADDVTCSEES